MGINAATCSGTVGNGEYADQTYSYSTSTGNLSSKTGLGAYTYDSTQPHAVDAVTGYTYLYDPNGNMTRRDPSGMDYYDFAYDTENRLSQAKKNGAILATFTYDGDGNRVKSVVGFTTTLFAGQHYETSAGVVTKYYAAGGTRVAMRQGSTFYWLFSDHLGSTSKVANASGALHSQQLYKAWGETRFTSGTLPTRYTFTGQYTYATTSTNDFGMIYYGARFYDNALGRFVQPDSITPDQKIPLSWDRYAYAFNNPIKFNDPSGHCPWCIVGAVVGAAVGYGIQVYNNYQNGVTGSDAWTQNISAEPIVGGALVGAGAVIFAPAAIAAAGDVLAGAGIATGSTALFAAGSQAYNLSQRATDIIYPVNYPTLVIDSGKMPNIASNIQNAQANGAPSVLSRTTDQALIDANRSAATAGFSGPGSPDEYPFASTYQGGSGAFVNGVPLKEQRIQGGTLSQFYLRNNIQDGDKFKVQAR